MVIPNAVASSAPGSQPGTPASTRSASEVITNKSAMEAGSAGNSQEENEEKKVSGGRRNGIVRVGGKRGGGKRGGGGWGAAGIGGRRTLEL